jgi:hypothetical protein
MHAITLGFGCWGGIISVEFFFPHPPEARSESRVTVALRLSAGTLPSRAAQPRPTAAAAAISLVQPEPGPGLLTGRLSGGFRVSVPADSEPRSGPSPRTDGLASGRAAGEWAGRASKRATRSHSQLLAAQRPVPGPALGRTVTVTRSDGNSEQCCH